MKCKHLPFTYGIHCECSKSSALYIFCVACTPLIHVIAAAPSLVVTASGMDEELKRRVTYRTTVTFCLIFIFVFYDTDSSFSRAELRTISHRMQLIVYSRFGVIFCGVYLNHLTIFIEKFLFFNFGHTFRSNQL